ncbi:MAG: type II secretion system protein GspM [Halieaceae bacterium]|nr:type II secretion system protein GspM [Halieaceae bacterium]
MNWLLQRRRTLAYVGGTIAIAVILLAYLLLRLLVAASFYSAEADRLRPRIARLSGLETIEARVEEQLQAANRELRALVYPADEDSSALAASLQAEIRRIFDEAGMDVTNSQVLPARGDEGEPFQHISLKVTLSGGIDQLDASLRGLAALRPRLLIESMDVFPARGRNGEQGQNLSAVIQLAALKVQV